MIKTLLREVFKKGYHKGACDAIEEDLPITDDDESQFFNDWIDEAWEDGYIGDIPIPEFILQNEELNK